MVHNVWRSNLRARACLRMCMMLIGSSLITNSLFAGPTATLIVRVTDTIGGVIAGGKVEATNVETNITFPGETNEEGLCSIPNLPPGMYLVTVRKFAFRTVNKTDVDLHVQDQIQLNFSMELGSVTESVTVEAGAPLIQSSPERGGTFVTRDVSNLPLLSLNPISLARTLPGVLEPAGSDIARTLASDEATLFPTN